MTYSKQILSYKKKHYRNVSLTLAKGNYMSTTSMTKQDKVFNYLTKGKTLSQDSAYSLFDVGNLRATISDIKPMLRSEGFIIVTSTGRNGETRYAAVAKKSCRKSCAR